MYIYLLKKTMSQAPTFIGVFPTGSPDLSDDTVVETSLGKFTVSEAVTCTITSPTGTIYEIRTVASPADPNQPGRVQLLELVP